MNGFLNEREENFFSSAYDETVELLRQLCAIPAPSHHEDARAEFCRDWLRANGAVEAYIDEAKNVVCPVCCDGAERISVLMAHMDTVFPDMEPMQLREEDGRLYCPGAGDDTANLAVMLMCAKYVLQSGLGPKDGRGFLFVCNSCEEGLGNLEGSRKIIEEYGERTAELVSFDGYWGGIVNAAVGSERYEVEVITEGGHSYSRFGNRNAIAVLASMISTLYDMKPPEGGRTTYNVGMISGGTSVNTIAAQASMLYEYRSDCVESIDKMRRFFEGVVEAYRGMGVEINVRLLGRRPCAEGVDDAAQQELSRRAEKVICACTGLESVSLHAGSTDCNSSLAVGIPSVSFGVCLGDGAHTRGEWIELESLRLGLKLGAAWTLGYFDR